MRLLFYFYFIAFFLPFHQLIAQSNKPLSRDTLRITIGEDGKLKDIPGFALIAGNKYCLLIKVEEPKHQYAEFIKNFKNRLKDTYDRLDDEGYPFTKIYSKIWTSEAYDNIKKQIKDLHDILAAKDPYKALFSSSNEFSLFLGKDFLMEALFGKIYRVQTNLSKEVYDAHYAQNVELEFSEFEAKGDTISIEIFTPDLEKQFIYKYFVESRSRIADDLESIKVKSFYNKFNELQLYKKEFTVISSSIMQKKGEVICDENLYRAYNKLILDFRNEELIWLLRTGWISQWVQQWIWKLNGNISLNPLGFTDEKFLATKEGYDIEKAQQYNAHRTNIVDLMINSKDLNDTKINMSAFDMALKQKETGSEQYSYTSYNNTLNENNKKNAKELQLIYPKRLTIKFPVIDVEDVSRIRYRYYDASDELKGSKRDDIKTLSNKIRVTGVAYNLLPKEEFKIKETPVEVPNESQAVSSLKGAGDAISGVLSQAAPQTGILANLLSSFREPKNIVSLYKFGPGVSAIAGVSPKSLMNNKSGNFILKYQKIDNQYILRLYNRGRIVEQWNFSALINQHLKKLNLSECKLLKDIITTQLSFNYRDKEFLNNEVGTTELYKEVRDIQKKINTIVDEAYHSIEKNRVLNDITIHSSIIDLVTSPNFYTLPPAVIEPKKGSSPAYRNEFVAFADEKKAIEKNSEIIVINTETNKEKKKKDFYITAPVTRVTPSLGVAYIFNSFQRSEVKVENGVISNNQDEEQVRLITGFHIHLAPIILKDDRSIFKLKNKELLSRFSVFAGVSFPKPLYNLHPGVSADIWPGVKLTVGAHFYRFTNYTVLNNQVIDQESGYVYNKSFASINIDPVTFVKLIGIFK